ncbi:MAG: hypothetical protein TYPL_3960 [Candidatus Tyloplasma litorale]|nr:MAG: hypothetical protein TYPL_3960 [Mycoplasmatales bacterium]
MLKKIIIFLSILLIPLFFIFSIFDISEKNNLTSISDSSYNVKENEEYTPDPYIDGIWLGPGAVPDNDRMYVRVFFNDLAYANSNYDNIEIKLAEFEEPIIYNESYVEDEIALLEAPTLSDSNSIMYYFSNLDFFTTYHIEYISIDNDDNTWTSCDNLAFSVNDFPYVQDIELVDDSITYNSSQIQVRFVIPFFFLEESENLYNGNFEFWLQLENYDEILSINNEINDINLSYDDIVYYDYNVINSDYYYDEGPVIYFETDLLFTISGLEPETTYKITKASFFNPDPYDEDYEKYLINNFDLSFVTKPVLATINSIELVANSITDSSAQIKVTTSTTNFNEDDLAIQLAGHDGDLTTSTPVDGITLTYDSTNETEIIYTISGLTQGTQYTITTAEINDIETTVDVSFTTAISPAVVNSIQVVTDSVTDSSAQIKVTTSTTNFDEKDLILHLANHDGDLTITTPVDGITLTYDSTNETEIIYTISGLTQGTQYTITTAEINDIETTVDVSFTTAISPAVVNSIQVVTDSVTDSSAQIKVTTSTTNFNVDDLALQLAGHDGDLTTSTPLDGIILTYDSTNETEIYYTISGLTQNTQYTIVSAKLNDTEKVINESFTTAISLAIVNSIQVVTDSVTDSSAQIKVITSTTNFNVNDLVLHLANHDGDLTTTTPVDGITLTHVSTDGTEIIYTISGLESESEYTITSAKLNNVEKNIDLSFITSDIFIEDLSFVNNSIEENSIEIKIKTSNEDFNENNLAFHLDGYGDQLLTTSTSIDGVTLTYNSNKVNNIATYTISGLEEGNIYKITDASIDNDHSTWVEFDLTIDLSNNSLGWFIVVMTIIALLLFLIFIIYLFI